MQREEAAGMPRGNRSRVSWLLRILSISACLSVSTTAYCQIKAANTRLFPSQTKLVIASLKPGITRADVERECSMDAGLQSPFVSERYIIPGYHDGLIAVMIDIRFKPVGIPDEIYKDPNRFRDWIIHLKQPWLSATDIVLSVSPPYLQSKSYD
jgi:hypothetical protein